MFIIKKAINHIKYFLFFLLKKELNFFFLLNKNIRIREIYKKGYIKIDNFWEKSKCLETINVLDKIFNSNNYSYKDEHNSDIRLFGSENFDKNIKEFSSFSDFENIARLFNINKISFFSTMANRVQYKNNNLGSGMGWHRDGFYKSFKCMLYLNDVDENVGAFQIIKKTNSFKNIVNDSTRYDIDFRRDRLDKAAESILINEPKRLETIVGKAGTLIIFDTSLIHRGSPIKEGNTRYALTNYYYLDRDINAYLFKKMNVQNKNVKSNI